MPAHTRSLFLLAVLTIALPAFAKDRVVLSNGDIVSGAIVKKDGAKLTVKSEIFGEVTIPWASVAGLSSETDVTVTTTGGESLTGPVVSVGTDVQVSTLAGAKTLPLATVASIRGTEEQHAWERLQNPGWLQLWQGNFDMGLALARGNARTDTLTTTFQATRATRVDKLTTHFNQIYGTARINGVTGAIANAVRGGWAYDRNVAGRLFLSTLNDYEHDRFQNLDLRFVLGTGLGVNAIKRENATLTFAAGANYQRESFLDNLRRNSAEANFGNDVAYRFSKITSITQSFRAFVNLSNEGEYRINFDLSGVTAIRRWIGWHVTASDRLLSNPVSGRQRNDLLLSTGFRLTFAR